MENPNPLRIRPLSKDDLLATVRLAQPGVEISDEEADRLFQLFSLIYDLGAARHYEAAAGHLSNLEHELSACKAGQHRLNEWLHQLTEKSESYKKGPPCPP